MQLTDVPLLPHVSSLSYCFAWSCSWHRICGKASFIILSYMSLLIHCISRYTAGGIHIESYPVLALSCKSIKVWSSLLEHCPRWGKKGEAKQTYERKRVKGQCYYPFSTLVLQSSTMIFMIESLLCCHFHMLVGIFHYRTWLVYSNDGLPQKCPRSSWASKLDAHPLSFFCWAFIYLYL